MLGQQLIDYDRRYGTEIMDRMLMAAFNDSGKRGFESYYTHNDVLGLCQHLNLNPLSGNAYLDIYSEYQSWAECQDWASTLSKAELLDLGYIH